MFCYKDHSKITLSNFVPKQLTCYMYLDQVRSLQQNFTTCILIYYIDKLLESKGSFKLYQDPLKI